MLCFDGLQYVFTYSFMRVMNCTCLLDYQMVLRSFRHQISCSVCWFLYLILPITSCSVVYLASYLFACDARISDWKNIFWTGNPFPSGFSFGRGIYFLKD